MPEPKWMEIARAELERKVVEIPGKESNPRIEEYQKVVAMQQDDEVPWCSAFANWCMKEAGQAGSGSGAARSWLHWGEKLDAPKPGAVVVFWRDKPDGGKGHVAFYVDETPDKINVLGGNQGNRVRIAPYERVRVLGYRWPK
jgi:uncharacterized protein (TIGR02594 family)